jgi:hypothetical protein
LSVTRAESSIRRNGAPNASAHSIAPRHVNASIGWQLTRKDADLWKRITPRFIGAIIKL